MNTNEDCKLKNITIGTHGTCVEGLTLIVEKYGSFKPSTTTDGLWKEDPEYEESPWDHIHE